MASVMSSPAPDSPAGWTDGDNSPRKLAVRDKGKGPEKRKRATTNGSGRASTRPRTEEPEGDSDQSDTFDPDQSIEEKRQISLQIRGLMSELTENRDEYMKPDSDGLYQTVLKANALSKNVKQPAEAAIDAKLLVSTADASYRKTMRLTAGNIALGVDVDELVSKCIGYMRLGSGIAEDDAPELSSTQRQRRRPNRRSLAAVNEDDEDEDEIGDSGDMLNWEHLGKFACLPNIRRPATPGFLLGPLSVEKKVRKVAKRSAPFRPNNLKETRPEVLNADAIQKNEKNDLTAICKKILQRLEAVQKEAQDTAEQAFNDDDNAEMERIMTKFGLKSTGGIDMLKFVVNPRSFAQTIENLFYVSFLIRDGKIQLEFDEHGIPTLAPVDGNGEPGGVKHSQKQQAIFHMDMQVWREIIEEFDLKEPLIEHRREQSTQGPGTRGWYS